MNGIKYFRLIRGMKAITLAEKTGLSIGTIKNMKVMIGIGVGTEWFSL